MADFQRDSEGGGASGGVTGRRGGGTMRILYGVNGEGMGHATRSQVVIDDLLERHDVRVARRARRSTTCRTSCRR